MSSYGDPIDQLINSASTDESRFFVGSLLAGRYIAAADGVITDREARVFSETAQKALKLDNQEIASSILQRGVEPRYGAEDDLERLALLTDKLGEAPWIHIFCFACQIAGTNKIFDNELPRLEELATIWAIPIPYKDLLYANYLGLPTALSASKRYFEELISALHPDRLSSKRFGSAVVEIALTNARQLKSLEKKTFAVPSPFEEQAVPSDEESTLNSTFIASLEDSPARRKVNEIAARLKTLPGDILTPKILESAHRLEDVTHDDVFRIAVVGSFSSGKSTFLNALCGKDGIFPTSTIPCTGAVSILRHSEKPTYWKRLNDGKGTEVEIEEAHFRELVELPDDIDRAEHLATSDLDALIVGYPLDICAPGVEIIDSPGLNENPQRTRITEKYLKSADAVIYIMTVRQLASEQDREQIQALIEQIGDQHLFFVVNSFDEVAGKGDEEKKVKNRARSYFKSIYSEDFETQFPNRVHFLSALKVLQEKNQAASSSEFIQAFHKFEESLGQYLANAKGQTRWRHKATTLIRVLSDAYANASAQAQTLANTSDFAAKRQAKQRALDKIQQNKRQITRALENAMHTIEQTEEFLHEELGQSFQGFAAELPDLLIESSEHWTSEGNPIWGKKEIQRDFSEHYQIDLNRAITYWNKEHGQQIISEHLQKMIHRLNRDFEEIQHSMQEIGSLTDTGFRALEQGEDDGAFMTFMRAAGGFAAGGPLGALVGATMEWEDVAINFAANFAVGFGLMAIGASTGVLIPVVALVGAAQAVLGVANAKDDIRHRILEAGLESLPDILDEIVNNLVHQLAETFSTLAIQVQELVELRSAHFEELAREQLRQLEAIGRDEERRKQEAGRKKALADQIQRWSEELDPFATITTKQTFRKLKKKKRTPKASALGFDTSDSMEDWEDQSGSDFPWGWVVAAVIFALVACAWFFI